MVSIDYPLEKCYFYINGQYIYIGMFDTFKYKQLYDYHTHTYINYLYESTQLYTITIEDLLSNILN